MRCRPAHLPAAAFILLSFVTGVSAARSMTFQDRIAAEEAIQRVYYAHLDGARRSFEEAMPAHLLEERVRETLKLSAALDQVWHRPVTSEMLRAEWERIRRETHFPGRLAEIEAALDHDPVLIQETFVRSSLVRRLARSWFAADRTIHARSRAEAGRLRDRLAGQGPEADEPGAETVVLEETASAAGGEGHLWRLLPERAAATPARAAVGIGNGSFGDPLSVADVGRRARSVPAPPGTMAGTSDVTTGRPGEPVLRRLPSEEGTSLTADQAARWRASLPESPGSPGKITEERDRWTIGVLRSEAGGRTVASFHHVPKRSWEDWWGANRGRFDEGSVRVVATDPEMRPAAADRGTATRSGSFAEDRAHPDASVAATSGSGSCLPDDVWSFDLTPIPSPHRSAVTVWTGDRMIVYGNSPQGGNLYDPLTDSWELMPRAGQPVYSYYTAGVWTGSELIVWGGYSYPTGSDEGGRFDPSSGTWTAISTTGAPTGRFYHSAVWTGSRMIVWGGTEDNSSVINTGGIYDPSTDTWSPMSTVNAPSPRYLHTAIWTGSEMIVFGGADTTSVVTDAGRYDPATDTWSAIDMTGAPAPRQGQVAVWTGSRMVVWGGEDPSGPTTFGDGALYDPATNSWSPVSMTNAPAPAAWAGVSWTGSEMIVWGGRDAGGSVVASGGRYDPAGDAWTATAVTNAPPAARYAGSVWAGDRAIFWGGVDNSHAVNTGGLYDPSSDTWVPTLSTYFPGSLLWDAAVWTGDEMIVWGGSGSPYTYGGNSNAGGRFDPLTDMWTPTTITGAPEGRVGHSAVWTGDSMIVWGGSETIDGYDTSKASGGIYDPLSDSWTPTSEVNAPQARMLHWAFWTGDRMLVWGGTPDYCTDIGTGALYDPVTDTWTPTTMTGAALPRDLLESTAVWTGSEMIVWGGYSWEYCGGNSVGTQGGRYDPDADSWSATSAAPFWQYEHSAQWTGTEMIIWGGRETYPYSFPPGSNAGTRYDPVRDAWRPTTTLNAPEARELQKTVWTGKEMIVWGGTHCVVTGPGSCSSDAVSGGGRYDPYHDRWTPMTTVDEAAPRYYHHVFWTGQEMLVYGGNPYTGGRYALGGGTDNDGDGFSECDGDCYDGDPNVYPGAPAEVCDGEDTDCDGNWPADDVDADADGSPVCAGDCDDYDPLRRPGLAEACDGIDNDCDLVVPADEVDNDGDGHRICDADCDDGNASVWAPPAPVDVDFQLVTGGSRLYWDPQYVSSGTSTTFDIFTGSGDALPSTGGDFSGGTCAAPNLLLSYFTDTTPDPPLGGIRYFILRAQNACGSGTYGDANRDATAALSSNACP